MRIFATCRRLGIGTVAAVGPGDESALHVRAADEAVEVASYLDAEALVSAARECRRNARPSRLRVPRRERRFRRSGRARGSHVGRPAAGCAPARRRQARGEAHRSHCGVPTLPTGEPEELGFPLLVKAAAGGGGRGMRVVERAEDLADALDGAAREAEAAFGDGTVFCERYLASRATWRCRCSATGTARSSRSASATARCSAVTRRSWRSPRARSARPVPRAARRPAIAFATELRYESAGTAEFLVDGDQVFFLELNARIQVEHPVTEAVAGLDLVELQLRVANGERLAGLEPARMATPSKRGSTPRIRGRSSRRTDDHAARAPGVHPRRRGRCRGRRGRHAVRPDDREARRTRRRSRRSARSARRRARRDGRRRGRRRTSRSSAGSSRIPHSAPASVSTGFLTQFPPLSAPPRPVPQGLGRSLAAQPSLRRGAGAAPGRGGRAYRQRKRPTGASPHRCPAP